MQSDSLIVLVGAEYVFIFFRDDIVIVKIPVMIRIQNLGFDELISQLIGQRLF